MKFDIDKKRQQEVTEDAKRVINDIYEYGDNLDNMKTLIIATKWRPESEITVIGFRFEFTRNNPYIGQVITNDDRSVSKIIDII